MKVGEIEVLPVFDGFGYEVAREVLLNPEAGKDAWARHETQPDPFGRLVRAEKTGREWIFL